MNFTPPPSIGSASSPPKFAVVKLGHSQMSVVYYSHLIMRIPKIYHINIFLGLVHQSLQWSPNSLRVDHTRCWLLIIPPVTGLQLRVSECPLVQQASQQVLGEKLLFRSVALLCNV